MYDISDSGVPVASQPHIRVFSQNRAADPIAKNDEALDLVWILSRSRPRMVACNSRIPPIPSRYRLLARMGEFSSTSDARSGPRSCRVCVSVLVLVLCCVCWDFLLV